MRWSLKVARVAGIDIFVHATFGLLLAYVALAEAAAGHGAVNVAGSVIFTTTLFLVVVLHELGHALTARAFGIGTRDITLLPIGGVARLERIPEEPARELLIALAGPAVNVALAAALYAVLALSGSTIVPIQEGGPPAQLGFLAKLFWANVSLAVFNLLPAFPMDGGRVLRALLATWLEHGRATDIAASAGQILAVLLGFLGAFTNPMLILVALFVWTAAANEVATVHMRAALRGVPVARVMATRFQALEAQAPLATAVDHVLDGFQHDFPVTENGAVVGVLTLPALIRGLSQLGPAGRVSEVMDPTFQVADATEMLEPAVARLDAGGCRTLPVLRRGELVGMLTPENVGELFMVQSALEDLARNGPRTASLQETTHA